MWSSRRIIAWPRRSSFPPSSRILRDVYTWLRQTGPEVAAIDPERIAVIGHSAGGYLTLMAGGLEPRPRALVAFYGYGDIIGPWYSQPDPFYCGYPAVPEAEARANVGQEVLTGMSFDSELAGRRWRSYLYYRQRGLWPQEVGGHDPHKEADWFRPYCPLQTVTPDYPPTLLLHGDEDTDVPVEQSRLMAQALAAQGVAQELRILPGQPHGFDGKGMDNPLVAEVFEQALAFLSQHTAS